MNFCNAVLKGASSHSLLGSRGFWHGLHCIPTEASAFSVNRADPTLSLAVLSFMSLFDARGDSPSPLLMLPDGTSHFTANVDKLCAALEQLPMEFVTSEIGDCGIRTFRISVADPKDPLVGVVGIAVG